MTKKDTKLENLSKTVHMLIEEIRLSETEGLDRIFMDVYSQQADMMTDSRQQGKVKHAFRDILGIVFFGVLAGNDEWEDIYDFAMDERETLRNYPEKNPEEVRQMCKVMEDMRNETTETVLLQSIKNLMKTMKLTADHI